MHKHMHINTSDKIIDNSPLNTRNNFYDIQVDQREPRFFFLLEKHLNSQKSHKVKFLIFFCVGYFDKYIVTFKHYWQENGDYICKYLICYTSKSDREWGSQSALQASTRFGSQV